MKSESNKSYKYFKFFQLFILITFFLTFIIMLKLDPVLKNNIYTNTNLLTICVFLWGFMVFCFVAIIFDLIHLEKSIVDSHSLHKAAYLDSLTGIPNRQSCDMIFEQYENDKDISDLGCSLVSISNLALINETLGRERGNALLQQFASVFEKVGDRYGFVGRNGGNEFLIVIEYCDENKMTSFIKELSDAVRFINEESNHMPITYKSYYVLNNQLKKDKFGDLITSLYKLKGSSQDG